MDLVAVRGLRYQNSPKGRVYVVDQPDFEEVFGSLQGADEYAKGLITSSRCFGEVQRLQRFPVDYFLMILWGDEKMRKRTDVFAFNDSDLDLDDERLWKASNPGWKIVNTVDDEWDPADLDWHGCNQSFTPLCAEAAYRTTTSGLEEYISQFPLGELYHIKHPEYKILSVE